MNADDFKRIIKNPNLISSIYNYCNRWCERCPFRQRCAVYQTDEEAGLNDHVEDPEAQPPTMEQSLDAVKDSFAAAGEMLEEMAKEQGLDWDEIVAESKKTRPRKKRKKPAFLAASRQYGMTVHNWFKAHKHAFETRGGQLVESALAGIPGEDPETVAASILDAVQVIQWYQFLIGAKLARAWPDDEFDDDPDEAIKDLESDNNGSAKVALQGLDESIAAWTRLRDRMPDLADDIISHLATLDQIRRAVEKSFPKARRFKRPGFDDPKYAHLLAQFRVAPK